jgi:hypothetical protein
VTTLFIVIAVAGALGLINWLWGQRATLRNNLQRERAQWSKDRELLLFDLEMARALARSGRVFLVESADALVDPDYWRQHTFFLNRDEAETYAESLSHWGEAPIPGALTRIREITADDLPPAPRAVRPWTAEDHATDYATGGRPST